MDETTIRVNRALTEMLVSLTGQVEHQPLGLPNELALLGDAEALAKSIVDLMEEGQTVHIHFFSYGRQDGELWARSLHHATPMTNLLAQQVNRGLKGDVAQFLRDVPELLAELGYWKLLLPDREPEAV